MAERSEQVPESLGRLAAAHGVATRYLDADDVPREPPASTVRACLAAMGVDCADDAEVAASLAASEAAAWARGLPPTAVVRLGADAAPALTAVVDAEGASRIEVLLEGGGPPVVVPVPDGGRAGQDRGRAVRRVEVPLPADLPVGAHRLRLVADGHEAGAATAHLLVVPRQAPPPPPGRRWGWQVQLYAMRSRRSWGIGDLADLELLVRRAGAHGADFVLLNPLHAATPVLPQEPSPYYPASRRAANPLYLAVEACDGWEAARGPDRDRLEALSQAGVALAATPLVDRDAVFSLKDEALRTCARQALPPDRLAAFEAFRARGGASLRAVATAFALARRHGPTVAGWPQDLRRADPVAVAEAAGGDADLAAEADHQMWLQWQLDEQLRRAQAAARDAGMAIGLVTDLAVGVDAQGADGWALAGDLARDVTVGAPPDALAQRGQDWRLPPLRPDRLAATGYAALRELVAANLRHSGGLRIDHVMGLFRLFWIPEGAPATDGTYVRNDPEGMLAAVVLEASRAGALLVGEDLGTVEDGVREALADRGVLGSAVVWFEQPPDPPPPGEDPRPARAEEYRALALTSVTTHDLPTVAGWIAGEPVRIRAATGQLAVGEAEDRARADAERAALVDVLVADGVLDPSAREDPAALADAVHAFAARTPSVLVGASLPDAVGDLRQPNLPGTGADTYPSWCLPIAVPDPAGTAVAGLLPPSTPIPLEDLLDDPRTARLAALLSARRPDAAEALADPHP
jgi:4-alpha-glucanotransferase